MAGSVVLSVIPNALNFSHQFISQVVRPGDTVVDATLGNGHDALFLAQLVGPGGQVYGFDIQPAAIAATERRLRQAGAWSQSYLFLLSHRFLHTKIPTEQHGRVRGVMFNLGYLPGGDKGLVTQPQSTVAALETACQVLTPGGRITVVAYPGHPEGYRESQYLREWMTQVDHHRFHVLCYEFLNQPNYPPLCFALEKLEV